MRMQSTDGRLCKLLWHENVPLAVGSERFDNIQAVCSKLPCSTKTWITPAHPATYWRAEGLNSCMKAKSLFPIIPALMISVAMATTSIAAEKVKPEAVIKGMLTALNNQIGLSTDPQNKP